MFAISIDNDALTAWATVAAVLAALFGPRIIEWERSTRKTPRLTVKEPNDFAAKTSEQVDSRVELSNAPGRDPALDVEVFLTVWSDEYESGETLRAIPVHLRPLATIPRINPGFLREVNFVRLKPGGDGAVGDWLPGVASGDIFVGGRYIIELAVTGSNLDPVYFSGHATIDAVTTDDDDGVSFRWTRKLAAGRAGRGEPFAEA